MITDVKTTKILGIRLGRGSHTKRITASEAFFRNGNKHAAAENMSPESHAKRMAGLRKAWEKGALKRQGVEFVTVRDRKRQRVRLRQTIVKEAREIQEIARTHADQAMQKLAEIINDDKVQPSVAILAAQVILDRAYGKASQTNINANLDANGKPSEITGKELDQRIAAVLKRVEDITGGAPEAPKSEERPADVRKPDRDPDGPTKH